jgi:TrmH RNA methyltransferase
MPDMSDYKPPQGDSPYRGPSAKPRDKRERERDRQGRPAQEAPPRRAAPPREPRPAEAPRPPREQRIHGLNACLALFAQRPGDLRKVWLLQSRIPKLKAVLEHCTRHRIGYTVVEEDDLAKLAASTHHEGVVFGAVPAAELDLPAWLAGLAPGPQLAIWLDGVGNPHNLGAILRSAAHFGVAGLLLPEGSPLALSGAAARVSEGGAERVPLVRLGPVGDSLARLGAAGFTAAATVVRGGQALYGTALPARLLLVMGAEQSGVGPMLAEASALRLVVPGTGAVESLNVSAATAVFVGEWWRQHRA